MFRTIYTTLAAVALTVGLACMPASAQDAAQPATPGQADAAQAGPAPSQEQVAAALEFLRVSGATRGFEEMIPQYLNDARMIYAQQRPELEQVINDVAIEIVPEVMKQRASLNERLADLYARRFSLDELKQLSTFYNTPVGQKLASNQVKILQDSVPIVQKWNQELVTEVRRLICDGVKAKGGNLCNVGPAAAGGSATPAIPPSGGQ